MNPLRLGLAALTAALLAFAGSGCATLDDLQTRDTQISQLANDQRTLHDDNEALKNQIDALQKDNARLAEALRGDTIQLAQRLALLEKQYSNTDVAYRAKLQELQKVIDSESKLRQTAITDVVTKMGAEMDANNKKLQELLKGIQKNLNASASSTASQGDYTVQKGDSLALIGRAFNVSADSLRKANNLKSDNLRAGQKLTIPKK